jgi:hypothetical protein
LFAGLRRQVDDAKRSEQNAAKDAAKNAAKDAAKNAGRAGSQRRVSVLDDS